MAIDYSNTEDITKARLTDKELEHKLKELSQGHSIGAIMTSKGYKHGSLDKEGIYLGINAIEDKDCPNVE